MGQRLSNSRISKRVRTSLPGTRNSTHEPPISAGFGQADETVFAGCFQLVEDRRSCNFDSLPNDESEIRRLKTQHGLFQEFWGNNFSSPMHERLTNGRCRVLDCGCGTGSWILDLAETYPRSTFVGIDSVSIFPKEIEMSNAAFITHDILHGLPFPQSTFDFVYQRFLWAAFTQKQWAQVVDELTRVLKIGGYLEFMEFDIQVHNPGAVGSRLSYAAQSYMLSKLMDPSAAHTIQQLMLSTRQFVDVKVEVKQLPIGWGGRYGDMGLAVTTAGFSSMQAALSGIIGVDSERYRSLLETYSREGKRSRMYLKVLRIYGRKVNQYTPGSTLSRAEFRKNKEKAWSF